MRKYIFKNTLTYFIIATWFFSSCNQVLFTSPQPRSGKTVTSFKINEIGTYIAENLPTIKIEENNILIDNQKLTITKKAETASQIDVRKYENCYFFNYPFEGNYAVVVGYFYENKLALYMLNTDNRSIKYLSEITPVKPLNESKLLYQAHPLGNEFTQIFENELFELVAIYQKE